MLTRKKFLKLSAMTMAAPLAAPFVTSAKAADKPIVWKSSGHGPASDPSQIYHDLACKAITRAAGTSRRWRTEDGDTGCSLDHDG